MKRMIILFLLINSTFIFSQDQVVVGLPNQQILYRNYPNKVQFAFTKSGSKNLEIKCKNCDTIYTVENKNFEYIIFPGEDREVKLYIKNKKVREDNEISFRVSNLPIPSVYFGPISNGNTFDIVYKRIFVKYPPEISLLAEFDIRDWEITIDDKKFNGKGKELSKEVISYLENIQKDSIVKIKVNYNGMGGEGATFGQFTILEKSKQKKQEEVIITNCE